MDENMKNKLDDVLGIQNSIIEEKEIVCLEPYVENEISQQSNSDECAIDFEEARRNIKEIAIIGMNSLKAYHRELQDMNVNPRAQEVMSTMLKTVSDINKDVLELHNQKMTLIPPTEDTSRTGNITIQKAVIATSNDILSMIHNNQN